MTKKERAKIKAEIRAELKKRKLQKTDGLGAYEKKKIRSALRAVWHRSHARKLVVLRCTGMDGFSYCEQCHKRTPALKVDHIVKVGEVDRGLIERMFCPSSSLQGLCRACHGVKTNQERRLGKRLIRSGQKKRFIRPKKRNTDWGF